VTAFVALLALDARRIEQRRCDLAPCVVLPKEEDENGRQSAPAEGGHWAEERSVSAVLHRYMTQVCAAVSIYKSLGSSQAIGVRLCILSRWVRIVDVSSRIPRTNNRQFGVTTSIHADCDVCFERFGLSSGDMASGAYSQCCQVPF
jgi:hypothetical protein